MNWKDGLLFTLVIITACLFAKSCEQNNKRRLKFIHPPRLIQE